MKPSEGDLIMTRDFSKAGLTPHWEPNAYRCKGYNESRTQIIVMDATGRQWFETIEHVKPYNLSPEFTDTGGTGTKRIGRQLNNTKKRRAERSIRQECSI